MFVCTIFLKNPNQIKKKVMKTMLKILLKNSIFSTKREKITVYFLINSKLKFWLYICFKKLSISNTIKCSEIANENYPLPIHDVHTGSHLKCRQNHQDGHPPQPEILVQRKKRTFKSFCQHFFKKRLISIDIQLSSFRFFFIRNVIV